MSRIVALVLLVLAAVAPVLMSAPSVASGECARWAATWGDDESDGTQTEPYRSLDKLVDSLLPGQAGCLPAGQTYWAVQGNGVVAGGGTVAAAKTITSAPGPQAVVKGEVWLQGTSHDLRIENLDLAGGYNADGSAYAAKSTLLRLDGDRLALVANEISNPFGTCVGVGSGDGASPRGPDPAADVRIVGNDIHGCGMSPDVTWDESDGGAHGIDLEHTLRAVVRQNLVHGNRYRGLQLGPHNDGADIGYNTFDENATHVHIGSSIGCAPACGSVSEGIQVHHNLMSNRLSGWQPIRNPSQVHGHFTAGTRPGQYGNVVHDNCLEPNDATTTGRGYQARDNLERAVTYADHANGDYRLTADSDCLGTGPSRLQPVDDEVPTVMLHDASVVEGTPGPGRSPTLLHMTVTRTGDLSEPTSAAVAWEGVTATSDQDYDHVPDGQPLFEVGESTAELVFEVWPDDLAEGDETFSVTLSRLQNGTTSDGQAVGTILDDDGARESGGRSTAGPIG